MFQSNVISGILNQIKNKCASSQENLYNYPAMGIHIQVVSWSEIDWN